MRYPIRDFLEVRTASALGFSPSGARVLVSSNLTGTAQLYRVEATGGEPQAVTRFDEPVGGAYLPASDEVLVTMDAGGNERHQLYVAADDGSAVRKLVHDPDVIHRPGGFTRDGRLLAYASNDRNGVDFDVCVVDVASGETRRLYAPGGWCDASGFSPDGRTLAVRRTTERNMDNELWLVDVASGEAHEFAAHDDEAYVGSPAWDADSASFWFSTDIGREFRAVCRADARSGQWRPVLERGHDLSVAVDWPARTMAVEANEDGCTKVTLHVPATMERLHDVALPGEGVASTRFSRDGSRLAVTFSSGLEPGDAWVYDPAAGTTTRLTNSPCPVPRDELVAPEPHRFASFDGESVPAFVYLPRRTRGPAPVVVWVHGGPESQFVPSFNPVIQYLVHRGFAVVAPNVRGSTGYGKRYHHLDDVHKRLDSVRDLEALHAWMASDARLDNRRAALMGGSYGGFMVLAGLAFQPQLWAAGVDIVGISSWVTFLENTSAWRRAFREREYGRLERDREFLVEASPLTHVDRIRAPLFIVHGTNDPRVPLSEAHQLHDAVRAKGLDCVLEVYPDEGHGLAKLHNRLDAYPKIAAFLERVLRP